MKKLEEIKLKGNPAYSEKWLQDQIAADLTILGLGGLVLRAKEKIQTSGGRLDLLLEDEEAEPRWNCTRLRFASAPLQSQIDVVVEMIRKGHAAYGL